MAVTMLNDAELEADDGEVLDLLDVDRSLRCVPWA
jgi:hypothetical protein